MLEALDGAGNPVALYVIGHERISQMRASGKHTYHADGLGSIRALTDETGVRTDRYVYEAYGLLEHNEGNTENPFRYTGEQYDPNPGFYYLRAIYYNPATGRFPTMDTYQGRIHEPQTLHKYLYVHADPVNMVDPSGEFGIAGFFSGFGGRFWDFTLGLARGVLVRPINGISSRGLPLKGRIWLHIHVRAIQHRLPSSLGAGSPAGKQIGCRWLTQRHQVRVMCGNPNSPNPAQRVDCVQLRVDGKVIGRNGQPLASGSQPQAHIPFHEWRTWARPIRETPRLCRGGILSLT
ncbi:MAG: RHS repeat-associated core domain-containing protein, partial [Wenzhouxiangella sp.]|nr:RHS repeat-associated core domain-containing protein [Wenzhouxiangella sp.]